MCSPLVVFLLHALCARIFWKVRPGLSPLSVAALAVLCGYFATGFLAWQYHLRFMNFNETLWPMVYALTVYTCLSFCYFILFTMSETARRIHILRKLQERGPIPLNKLAAEYNATDMLSVRLERLVALKQLKHIQGRYFLNTRLLWWAGKVVSAWARLLCFFKTETR